MPSPAQEVSVFARAARRAGFWAPLAIGSAGIGVGLAHAANDVARQKRGDRMPTLEGHTMSLAARTFSAAALTSGLLLVPGIGPVAAGIVGTAAAFFPNAAFDGVAGRGFRTLSQIGRNVNHLEMGGRYVDSLSAQATRERAIQEMNGTMVASRRWLGSEAEILHR